MTNLAFGIILFLILGFVQYSWFYDPNNGVAIDFKSKSSYIITTIVLGALVGYLITTGIFQSY
ncbi:hypothetical protein ABFG93_08820 [Pseudalkalibacillus hwajinpoensis]|uniref:hypothetical protein n=1 Tax=Guptibacillus hwajinpoensis TaxID=208199 RepID=UPI00325A4F7B